MSTHTGISSASGATPAHITRFTIDPQADDVADLRRRLAATRWPAVVDESADDGGLSVAAVRRLVDHWLTGYDWPAQRAALNTLDQYLVRVDDLSLHTVHVRATPSSGLPVVLLHGWPDSFQRYHRLVPLLCEAGHDVVVPSLPGFLFSEQPRTALTVPAVAHYVHGLLAALGYERYAVHGGDWGSAIAEQLATDHPDAVAALHLADVPFAKQFTVDRTTASEAEQAFLTAADAWGEKHGAYYVVQSTGPTTLAYGLSDSPVGLLAWLAERYVAWSGQQPDADDVLTNAMLHWLTNSSWPAMRLYAESSDEWSEESWAGGDESGDADVSSEVGGWTPSGPTAPTAFAVFPDDISVAPREFAERFFDVRRYTVMPSGGHFGALEEPGLLAEDIHTFLAGLD